MGGKTSRVLVAVLVLFLFALPAPALAHVCFEHETGTVQAPAGRAEMSPEAQQMHDNLFNTEWQQHQTGQGLLSRAIARLMSELVGSIVWALGLQDHVTLIFGVEPTQLITSRAYIPPENLVLYTFTQEQAGVIGMFYDALGRFTWILLVIAVLIGGYLVFMKSMSAEGLATGKDYLLGLLIFLGLMLFGGVLVEPLFFLNRAFVLFIGSQVAPALEAPIFEALFAGDTLTLAGNPIAMLLIVLLIAIGLALFNFQYTMRAVSLGILLLMFPVVAYRAVYPSGRAAIGNWFKEFTGNLFMQSGHAVAYAVLISFFVASQNIFLLLAMIWSLNSIAGMVRNLLGAEGGGEGMGGAMAGMMGLTALMGVKSLFSSVNSDAAASHAKTLGEKGGVAVSGAGGGVSAASSGAGALNAISAGGSAGAPLMFDSGLRKATAFKSGLTKAAIGVGMAAGAIGMAAAFGPAGVAAGVKVGSSAGRAVGKFGGGIATAIGSASDTRHEIALKAEEEGVSFRQAALDHYGYMDKDQLKDPESAGKLGHDIGSTFGWVPAVIGQHGAALGSKIYGLATGDTAAGKYGDAQRTIYQDDYVSSARHDKDVAEWAAEQKAGINVRLAKYGPGSSPWMALSQNTTAAKNRLDSEKQQYAALQKRRDELKKQRYDEPKLKQLYADKNAAYRDILGVVQRGGKPTREQNEKVSRLSREHRDMFEARPDGMHILQKKIDATFAGIRTAEDQYNAAREAEKAGPAEYAKAKQDLSVVDAMVAQSKADLLLAQQKYERRHELIGSQFRDTNKRSASPGGFDSVLVGDSVVR